MKLYKTLSWKNEEKVYDKKRACNNEDDNTVIHKGELD